MLGFQYGEMFTEGEYLSPRTKLTKMTLFRNYTNTHRAFKTDFPESAFVIQKPGLLPTYLISTPRPNPFSSEVNPVAM